MILIKQNFDKKFTLLDLQKRQIAAPLAKTPTIPVIEAHTPIMFRRVVGGFSDMMAVIGGSLLPS